MRGPQAEGVPGDQRQASSRSGGRLNSSSSYRKELTKTEPEPAFHRASAPGVTVRDEKAPLPDLSRS